MILTAKAFLDQNPKPSDAQIAQSLATTLCRCFAHTRMLRAIRKYADRAGLARRSAEGAKVARA